MAEIHKLRDHAWDTTPELLLDMVKANLGPIKSVVVSIENDEGVGVYWTRMDQSVMAWHTYIVHDTIIGAIRGDDEEI